MIQRSRAQVATLVPASTRQTPRRIQSPLHTVVCPFSPLAGIAAAAVAGAPQQAAALVNPAQESYGGLGRATGRAGSSPKSPTRASMEGYTLEGTKKQGITAKRKQKLLARARKDAVDVAAAK
jgi:hypothetical protein